MITPWTEEGSSSAGGGEFHYSWRSTYTQGLHLGCRLDLLQPRSEEVDCNIFSMLTVTELLVQRATVAPCDRSQSQEYSMANKRTGKLNRHKTSPGVHIAIVIVFYCLIELLNILFV